MIDENKTRENLTKNAIPEAILSDDEEYSYSYSYSDKKEKITFEQFQEYFELLKQDKTNWTINILKIIYSAAKYQQYKVNSEQFCLILYIAENTKKKLVKQALEIIFIYSPYKRKCEWFFSIIPPNFFERIYSFLPREVAFSILLQCVKYGPSWVTEKLTSMNIIEPIMETIQASSYSSKSLIADEQSLYLFSSLLKIFPQHYESFLNSVVQYLLTDPKSYKIDLIIKIIEINSNYVPPFVQNPLFMQMFTPKQCRNKRRYKLIDLLNSIMKIDTSLGLQFASTSIWDFVNDSFCIGTKGDPPKKERNSGRHRRHQKRLLKSVFDFLFYVGWTPDGKLFLFSQNVHNLMFQLIETGSFNIVDGAIKVLCQIAQSDAQNILDDLLSKGLIDVISVSLTSLSDKSCLSALDCLLNIERFGELNNSMDYISAVYSNPDLVSDLLSIKDLDNDAASQLAMSLIARIDSFSEFNYVL